jgi:hypothetical protein
MDKKKPSSGLSATFSHLQEQTGEGQNSPLLPSFLGWEKVPEGRMRALSMETAQ